ncbi:MAG TPA: hypothetical protein VN688_16670 [Gemmataceae bacterium]|nr:hypothetical protein [Gemmataceae bacterium]
MSKTIEDIHAPKPEARPRIYAYSIADAAHNMPRNRPAYAMDGLFWLYLEERR